MLFHDGGPLKKIGFPYALTIGGTHFLIENCYHLPLVPEFVQEEVAAGFVRLVPGGLDELKSQYDRIAIGKLGVVIADGRSPRLVGDSSIFNVTSNNVIPNHMLLPRISDVMACTPLGMATDQMIQLT